MTASLPKPGGGDARGSEDGPLPDLIAAEACRALSRELTSWPKPGLVSHLDSGSHGDMDAQTFRRSIAALRPYFAELAAAGAEDADMSTLRAIGRRAEAAMLRATAGINTHRGAIFGLGLLCAATGAGSRTTPEGRVAAHGRLGRVVAERWGDDILRGPVPILSHGTTVLRRYGAGGARIEAASGFASVYEIGLPALRRGRDVAPGDSAAPPIEALFALIARVRDTNLLHRGGTEGARYAAASAAGFLAAGGVGTRDWRYRAAAIHAAFIARRLSPGGCADLLAMTLFVDAVETPGGLH